MINQTNIGRRRNSRYAFSLTEMVVVLVIIGILLSAGLGALRDSGGNRLNAAVNTAGQMFERARALAISKGTKTRVIISRSTDPGRFLREFAIVYKEDAEDGSELWQMNENPVFLPSGIYVDENAGIPNVGLMNITHNRSNHEQIYYSFSSVGTSEDSGSHLVLAVANLDPDSLALTIPNPKMRRGFVLRRLGRITFFRSPEQIESATIDSN